MRGYSKLLKEKIIKIERSTRKNKKYSALIRSKNGDERKIHFGDKRYEQYNDSAIGTYSHKNHLDKKRRDNYFNRFSGTPNKKEAIMKELRKSSGKLNAKILSHFYLW